jgi:hypothetical protein
VKEVDKYLKIRDQPRDFSSGRASSDQIPITDNLETKAQSSNSLEPFFSRFHHPPASMHFHNIQA